MAFLGPLLIIAFVFHSWVAGLSLVRFLYKGARGHFLLASSFVLGIYLSVWLTYVISGITRSVDAGFFLVLGAMIIASIRMKLYVHALAFKLSWADMPVLLGCIGVAGVFMWKSVHAGDGGILLVGTNEIFDFAHALSVIRSFSLGQNVPYGSPFIAGAAHVYHFLFYFWAGLLERFGIPIVYAYNIPSVIAFAALLVLIYDTARMWFGSVRAGIIALYLSLTHSTLMFIPFVLEKWEGGRLFRAVWTNAQYYRAGPYDGSDISIFWTLNVFVNQRHLIFGLAVVFVLWRILSGFASEKSIPRSRIVIAALMAGLLPWWHMSMFLAVAIIGSTLLVVRKQGRQAVVFGLLTGIVGAAQLYPMAGAIGEFRSFEGKSALFSYFLSPDLSSLFSYWIMNIGIALITVPLGFLFLPKPVRFMVFPFAVLFILGNAVRFGSDISENHKLINAVLIVGSILSAGAVARVSRKGAVGLVLSILLLLPLSISGVIDAMVIKNDFQFPVADVGASPLMQWIKGHTDPQSIFLSYQDMLDPVAFAGRKTYFGFFGGKAYPDRSLVAKTIYEASNSSELALIKARNIDFVVVPKWEKPDFPYRVNVEFLRSGLQLVYEDDRHAVFTPGATDSRNLIE